MTPKPRATRETIVPKQKQNQQKPNQLPQRVIRALLIQKLNDIQASIHSFRPSRDKVL